jgi:hypothetical protein
MLAIFGSLIASLLSGGATGIIGVLIQRFFDMKNKAQDIEVIKLQHANAVELRRVELEVTAAEYAGKREVAKAEAEGAQAVAEQDRLARESEADAATQTASYEHDKATYYKGPIASDKWWAVLANSLISFLLGLVDVLRGATRPVLTGYTMALLTMLFLWVQELLTKAKLEQFTIAELKELVMLVVATITYLTTVGFVWWFGTRPPKKDGDK